MEKTEIERQYDKDIMGGMDSAYNELIVLLRPVMHNKIKFVNGKLLKDCFKQIKRIIEAHQYAKTHIL